MTAGRIAERDVRKLMHRAGIVEPHPIGTGTLTTEPLLILQGSPSSDLQIYDQRGRWLGEAARSRDRYTAVGYHHHYNLRDTQLRCVLRNTTRGRWSVTPKTYAIVSPEGSAIALASRPLMNWRFERDDEVIATLHEVPSAELGVAEARGLFGRAQQYRDRHRGSQLFYLEDESDRLIARMTHLRTAGIGTQNWFVLELGLGAAEMYTLIAVAGCVVANDTMIER